MRRNIIRGLLYFVIVQSVSSTEKLFTLEECISLALQNNVDIQNARANLAFVNSLHKTKKNERLGQIGFQMSEDISNRFVSYYDTKSYYSARFILTQPIFVPGLITRVKQSQLMVRSAGEYLKEKEQAIIYKVCETYYDVVRLNWLTELNQLKIVEMKKFLNALREMHTAGLVTEIDISRVENRIKYSQQTVLKLQNATSYTKECLSILLGLEPEVSFEIQDKVLLVSTTQLASLDKYIEIANRYNSEMSRNRTEEQIADLELQIAKASSLPTVNFAGGYGYEGEFQDLQKGWAVRLFANLQLWDWGYRDQSVIRSSILKQQAKIKRDSCRRRIESNIRKNYDEISQSAEEIKVLSKEIEIAEKVYAIEKDKYFEGKSSLTEVMHTFLNLVTAKENYVNTIYQYLVSKAQLEFFCGTSSIQ